MSYLMVDGGRAIQCGECGKTSWSLGDIEHKYCGHCKKFHEGGDTVVIDCYAPDHDAECFACGSSPTVCAVKNGKLVLQTGMCGPCLWGEADMVHPENWNG